MTAVLVNLPGELTTGAGGGGSVTVTVDAHTLVEDNIPKHYHYGTYANTGTDNVGDANSTLGINMHDGGGDAEYRLKRTSGSYSAEHPNAGRN